MPTLTPPTTTVHRSFLAAMAEFRAEGRGEPEDHSMIGWEIREFGAAWVDPDVFDTYVRTLLRTADEDAPLPEHFVPTTTWWWVDGDEYLGRIAFRRRLNQQLRINGGHIGYDVRASARGRGHATAMLAAVLPYAHAAGVDRALLTCDVGNVASRRVIEANGGELDEERLGRYYFWVPTG